jgi:uncharacterized protein (TIGR03437 family)
MAHEFPPEVNVRERRYRIIQEPSYARRECIICYRLSGMRFLRGASVAVALVGLLSAQTSTRDQQRLADVQYIATQLPDLHPNFFFQLSSSDFNAAIQTLTGQVPNLTDAEFAVRLAQLVAMAGDPHTALYLIGPTFPLSFRRLDDGMFVTGAGPEYAKALGTRLVQVGDTDIGTVLTQLGTVIPHTNMQWVQYEAQNYLRVQQVLQGLDLVPATASSPLTFADALGNQFTLNVTPSNEAVTGALAAPGPLPDFVQNSSKNYWFTYFVPQHVLYFKYNVCADDPSSPFAAFAANLLKTFDSNPVDTFIFDFRGNTGGDSSVINPLLNGLQQRTAAILGNPNFHVYDVIDGGTFSSGLDDAMEIKSASIAAVAMYPGLGLDKATVVIGAPSGGPPSGYGEVKPFSLPYLDLNGQYSTVYHPLPQYIPAGTAFNPDVPVANRSTDYLARHDPVLAAIFARSGPPPAPPSGSAIVVNGASFRVDGGIAPASYAAAFGSFPANVDGVFINGTAAQIVAATPSQINFVLPAAVSGGPATISVRVGTSEVANGQFTVTAESLGLFVLSADPSQPGAVLNSDYTINGVAVPALQNSVVQIFGTGFSRSAQVLFGDTPAAVSYSGPVSGVPGLWQINAAVPMGLSGQIPVYAIAGNSASNAVTVQVK